MRVNLYRRKGETPHWQAQVYVGGKRYRFSCQTENKETAREFARQRIAELKARHDRGLIGLPESVRVSQVFERYEREYAPRLRPSSRKRMLCVLSEALTWFEAGPLHDPLVAHVTPRDIQAFLEMKRSQGVTARTVNLYRANLHRVFHLCVRPWLFIPTNPVAAVEPLRHEAREPHLLSESEYDGLREACRCDSTLFLFVTLGWEVGARRGELLQLQWSDVDFERRSVTFVNDPSRGRHTKGRRSRTLPLSDAALRALRHHAAEYRLSSALPWVFSDGDKALSPDNLYDRFKKAAGAVGLPTLRPHDLRHAFVTRKLAEGVPAQLVMRYVGHADLATTLRYTHLVPEHLRAVVDPVKSEQGHRDREVC
jgi:integrase